MSRALSLVVASACFFGLVGAGLLAPDHLSAGSMEVAYKGPAEVFPFGTDARGRPLTEYAQQGARVIVLPALVAGAAVAFAAVLGGLLRCVGSARVDSVIQAFSELVGSLPRMVVILVVALLIPSTWRSLLPLGLAWAVLGSPGAMDEAAAVAERLGGARFVEALKAHGFSWSRIYLYHIVALNLRPVVVRQASETIVQVTFLEISLSYLSAQKNQSSFTHPDNIQSWAALLADGYRSLVTSQPSGHALVLGLVLVGLVTLMARGFTVAARAR